jgi:hypothetical protein
MKTHGKVATSIAALAALAVSGIALADHSPGHSKEKTKGPKSSVNITNTCYLSVDNMTSSGVPDHVLKVTTLIEDASDDNSTGFTVDSKEVAGEQSVKSSEPPKKQVWKSVGDSQQDPVNADQFNIHLCELPVLLDDAKALNASVQVEVDGRFFLGRCDDNPDTNCERDDGTEYVCEEEDESIILPVDEYGEPISCAPR